MNIFAIGGCEETGVVDWEQSARELDNYRVVKMILESCQMLCTTLNYQGFETPYRNAHLNHPSTKWVRESSANFLNLVKHTEAMLEEYRLRFGQHKIHKCQRVLNICKELYDVSKFSNHEPTQLPLCMPDEYRSDNVVKSYRNFYTDKPKMRYPKQKIPKWFFKRRTTDFEII
jgi:hypothetical protein